MPDKFEIGLEKINMRQWPHAPLHSFRDKGIYMLTAATFNHAKFFKTEQELDLLHDLLLELAEYYKWRLEAWAVFANHYHFVAHSPENPESLGKFMQHFHSLSAIKINKLNNAPARKIWHQFWDTHITFQNSYLARLNYVIQNLVKHKLVIRADLYPWCSASWFEKNATKAFFETVTNMKIDQLKVFDDF
jgi:putative transposase